MKGMQENMWKIGEKQKSSRNENRSPIAIRFCTLFTSLNSIEFLAVMYTFKAHLNEHTV